VAEMVETEQQLAALRSAGCDYVQGFLLARPAPAENLRRDLKGAPATGLSLIKVSSLV